MPTRHVFRLESGALSRLAFVVPGLGIAVIAFVIFLAANPTLIGDRLILFVVNPGFSGDVYWAVFLAPVIVAGLLRRRLKHNLPFRLAVVGYLVLILWLFAAIAIRFVTIPVYLIRPETADVMRLSGPVPFSLSNGMRVVLLNDEIASRKGVMDRPTRSIIINDSPKSSRLETVIYRAVDFPFDRPEPKITYVEPYGARELQETVDYFGPHDHPPASVSIPKGTNGTSRLWLTW